MAKIARRSVASNPSSLTSITIPSTSFLEHNFSHTTTHEYKRSTNSKSSEINIPKSVSVTTSLSYSSSLTTSSTPLRTSSTLSLTATTPLISSSEIETTEKPQLTTLSKGLAATATATTIPSIPIDPLRSTDHYQLTTRTIPKNFDNVSNNGKNPQNVSATPTKQTVRSPNNGYNTKNISNARNASQNDISTKAPSISSPSLSTSIPSTTAFTFNKTEQIVPRHRKVTTTESPAVVAAERERVRIEFYATYDVMTGVRIAATLGGFFSLMVFLIVWKSRSHSNETIKALKDPKTAALTVACMQEEEDRKIIEAMDATGMSIFPDEYDTMIFRRQRMLSIGNISAPPVLNRGFRFSSVGGYSSLLEPPRRFSISSTGATNARRRSASESSRILSNYPMGSSFGTDDYFIETDDELDEDYDHLNPTEQRLIQNHGFLEVPSSGHHDARRSSAMTCCSTESSYLERRCSALTLGINNLPPALRQKEEPVKKTRRGSSTETWDYYYPDIQIIQATPKSSPLASDKDFERGTSYKHGRTISQDTTMTAASGVSAITLDSSGSSWKKNSMACFYDHESLQDRRLPSIGSEHSLDFGQSNTTEGDDSSDKLNNQNKRGLKYQSRQPTIITTTSATPSPKTLTDKFDGMQELKLRKYSDASSCFNNNSSFSYYISNNNVIFDNTGSCIAAGITQPPSSTYSVSRAVRSNLRGVGTIGGTGIGRAPLASCSSFKMSSVEYQDSDMRSSLGDDESVFIESYADTDDDLEQFSTDSDEISLELGQTYPNETIQYIDDNGIMPTLPISSQQQKSSYENYDQRSFYENQISTKSAPPETLNGKLFDDNKKIIGKGAILKQNHQRTSIESHRTLSVSSSDKVFLVPKSKQLVAQEHGNNEKKIKTKPTGSYNISAQYNNKRPNSMIEQNQQHYQQDELLLKPILSPSNTPLLALKRSQFQQQYSDTSHSLPTTDETTTLETCSTEVAVVTTIVTTNLTGTSTTTSVFSPTTSHKIGIQQIPKTKKYQQQLHQLQQQQQQPQPQPQPQPQKPPITIKKQSSFSYDNNNDSSISSNSNNSNSLNKNLNKNNRLSSSSSNRNTNKKIKVKNRRTAYSDSSVPSQTLVPSSKISSRNKRKILIPQTLKPNETTEYKLSTITDNIIDYNNETKSSIISEKINIREKSKQIIGLFRTNSSSSSSNNSTNYCSSNKNKIIDWENSFIASTIQQQNEPIVEKLYSSSSNLLLEDSRKFSNYNNSTNNSIIKSKNLDTININIDNNKKDIVDVSIVIEDVECDEDNSIINLNKNKTKNIIVTDTNDNDENDDNNSKILLLDNNSKTIVTSTSVMLELPVIKIPTIDIDNDNDDSNNTTSSSKSYGDTNNEFSNIGGGRARSKSERCDPPIRDPSLPSSSRKWSKETLF